MNDQMLAEFYAKLGIKVDLTGIQKARGELKHLEQQAKSTAKSIQAALKNLGGTGSTKNLVAATQAQANAMHANQLQGAKLTKLNNTVASSGLQTHQQQVKLQIQQAKLAAQTAASQRAAVKATLQAQGQALTNQIKQMSLANVGQRNQLNAMRIAAAQHRAARQQAGIAGSHNSVRSAHGGGLLGIGGSAIHRFGGVGRFAGGITGSGEGALGGLEGLAGGAGRAAMGLGAVAGSAALVVAAFTAVAAAAIGYGREAERAANTRNARMGQFEAVGDRTPENAERMNNRYENFAQTEGLNAAQLGPDYAKIVGALSAKVGVDRAADTTEGIMRYGKAQHLSNDNMSRISLGLRQALGKNQLYSEEWTGQIAEHLGAHANEFGAEAWQRASGGKLTGDAAQVAFSKDRQNRKISGDMLTKFVTSLGAILNEHANDGGLLDKARMTQESQDNRLSNQFQSNLSRSYNDTSLSTAMPEMYKALGEALNELQPQFIALGNASGVVIKGVTGMVKAFTSLMNLFNSGGSYLDPKFAKDFSSSLDELLTSFTALYHTLGDLVGVADKAGIFKTLGETVVGVLTSIIDVMTLFVDTLTGIVRFVQDMLHKIPERFGGISDEDYSRITASRQSDDEKRKAIVDKRDADIFFSNKANGLSTPVPNVDPTSPWQTKDGSDIPRVDSTPWRLKDGSDTPVVGAPITAPVQPAVNGTALANSNTNNVTFTFNAAPITLTGVDPVAMKGELETAMDRQAQDFRAMVEKNSPAAYASTQTRARGN
jgi:hypothetical protein